MIQLLYCIISFRLELFYKIFLIDKIACKVGGKDIKLKRNLRN